MTYSAYPNYVDTNYPSLPSIPDTWLATYLKRYLTVQSGDMLPAEKVKAEGIPVVGGNGYRGFTEEFNTPGNTIVIGRVGAKCGCVHYIREKFWASEHAFRVKPRKRFNDGFMTYALKALNLNQFAITTAQPLLNTEIVTSQPLAIPRLYDEQSAIARFLDCETAKIDRLIEKQERLIELLKEKRQAVISHAVTKGLDPDAKMKDSGVEWLGEVPEHWAVSKLAYFASIGNGATPSRENPDYWQDGTVGWLNSSKINDGEVKQAAQFITEKAAKETSVHKVHPGDILIAITGEGKTRGMVALCKTEATINQHLAAISIRGADLAPEFLRLYLESRYEFIRFESSGAGSTKGAITCEAITKYKVPLPSLEEQLKIVAYIDERKQRFSRLISLSEQQVELLRERRSALISAAVTGKIDVRNWQPEQATAELEGLTV